jgi:hypothetical protein
VADAVVTTVFLLIGVAFVVAVLGWFWAGERYRLASEGLGPAERAWVAREAGDLLAEFAPEAILLVERERAVEAALRDERDAALAAFAWRRLEEAGLREFWEGFVRVSVLVEEDPAGAVRELPALRVLLEGGLEVCDELLGMLGGTGEIVEPVERSEGRGGE